MELRTLGDVTPRRPDARLKVWALALGLGALALLLYTWRLDTSPIYLQHDEIFFALQAQAISVTGHDSNGRLLPVYFEVERGHWFQPAIIYAMALVFKAVPLSIAAIRTPTAIVGAVNVVLMFFIARRLFNRTGVAVLTPLILTLTPAHFIHSRVAMDYLFPIPFVLGWLLCVLTFLETRKIVVLLIGTSLLGIGFYGYLAAIVMMPIYAAITGVMLCWARARRRDYVIALAGFAWPIVPAAVFLLLHPEMVIDFVTRYRVYGTPLPYRGAIMRIGLYWGAFDPSQLFFSGGANLINTTRQAGVFLLPLAVLLPFGIARVLRRPIPLSRRLLLLGLVSAPLTAVLVPESGAIDRMLSLVPFGVLLAACGIEAASAGSKMARAGLVVLLIAMPVQFAAFSADYFSGYRVRSSYWFEENLREAVDATLARDHDTPAPEIRINAAIPFVEYRWKWYLTMYGRKDLLARTVISDVNPRAIEDLRPGSLLLTHRSDDVRERSMTEGLQQVAAVVEPTGEPSFLVLTK